MDTLDLERCRTFVQSNRIIAERFGHRAVDLQTRLDNCSIEVDRQPLERLLEMALRYNAHHWKLAEDQERDLGVVCRCNAQETAVEMDSIRLRSHTASSD